jgi:hypothetical protein
MGSVITYQKKKHGICHTTIVKNYLKGSYVRHIINIIHSLTRNVSKGRQD